MSGTERTAALEGMKRKPRFGDLVAMEKASQKNPRKHGLFVRVVVRRRGMMNSGSWLQVTDGRGDFWLADPKTSRIIRGHPFSLCQMGILLSALDGQMFPVPKIGGRKPDESDLAALDHEIDDLVERGLITRAGKRHEFTLAAGGRAAP